MGKQISLFGSCILFAYSIIALCLLAADSEAQSLKTDSSTTLSPPRGHVLVRNSLAQRQSLCGGNQPEAMQVLSRIEVRRGMYDSLGLLRSSAKETQLGNSFGIPMATPVQQCNYIRQGRIPSDAIQSHAGDELIRMAATIAIDAALNHFHYRGALPPYPYDR